VLTQGYQFLRRLENRLRIERDQPVEALESDAEQLTALARWMGDEGAAQALACWPNINASAKRFERATAACLSENKETEMSEEQDPSIRKEVVTEEGGVQESGAEEDFATLLGREQTGPALHTGQVVKGRVILISGDSVFVDVRDKGEGIIDRAELESTQGELEVSVGDEIEATIVTTEGELRLSRKLLSGARAQERLELAVDNKLPVEGKVTNIIKGGYEVIVVGFRAFCPFSQMDMRRPESSEAFLEQTLEFFVTRYSENGRNIVLSRRQLLEEQAAQAAEETLRTIVPDAVLPGTVASLTNFGAFIDLGGVQGLVHISEISHSRLGTPEDRLSIDEAVTVKVLKIDAQTGKIALSMKALEGDPWAAVAEQLRERQVVSGRLVRMADFGAFVELLPGVDGLLHISEIPRNQHGQLKEAVTTHGDVAVLILSIDPGKRRIALALAPEGLVPGDQAEALILTPGAVVTGTVERIESFGVILRLGPGQTGLIANAEMGTPRGMDHRKEFPPETEVKVAVLTIEEGGKRIRLSRTKAHAHEEQAETQAYLASTQKQQGFGLSLGELLQQSKKKK